MVKLKKLKKVKLYSSLFGLLLSAGIVASCANPNQQTLQNLFRPGTTFGESRNNLSTQQITASALTQSAGFKTFLDNALAQVLRYWYDDNGDESIRKRIKTFTDAINQDYQNELQTRRDQFRNDYQVRFQTDVLDANGGSEASWKQNQLNSRILSDFNSLIFQESFLNYTDESNQVVSRPSKELLDVKNWSKIKFTNQTKDTPYTTKASAANNRQMFAEIQDVIFDQWVRQVNPNLVSRIVFTNQTPTIGFNKIFNKKLVATPTNSYEFQTFNPVSDNQLNNTPSSSYKQVIANNGLSQYVTTVTRKTDGDNRYLIDIPSRFSSDSGGKLLMSADEMYTTFDVAFTDAYVNQYLYDIRKDVNNIDSTLGAKIGAQIDLDNDNISKNFIRQKNNGDPDSAYTKLSYLTRPVNNENLIEDVSGNNFYSEYQKLQKTNGTPENVIYDFVRAKNKNGSQPYNDKFIVSRGKDGVHILGIDGGTYYLSSSGRNIEKQKEFLKFRSLYKSSGEAGKNDPHQEFNYDFSISSQLSPFFNKNSSVLLFTALSNALRQPNSYFNQSGFQRFRDEFTKLDQQISGLVNAFENWRFTTAISDTLTTIRTRLNERVAKYVTNEKDNKAANNGIAGRLPDVAAEDGSYPSQEIYQLLVLNDWRNNQFKQSNVLADDLSTKGTKNYIFEQVKNAQENLQKEAMKLANALNLQSDSVSGFSQNIILRSNTDRFYSLPINLAINSTIAAADTTNLVKNSFFTNSNDFKSFFDLTPTTNSVYGTFKPTPTISKNVTDLLPETIRTVYGQTLWQALNDKSSYGVPTDITSFNQIIDRIFTTRKTTSDDTLNYNTLIYTIKWLLENNLKNFKAIMQSRIAIGRQALALWSVSSSSDKKLDDNSNSSNNPLTQYATNPNYLWGSTVNWQNHKNAPSMADRGNDSKNPYQYTNLNNNTKRYGFEGVKLRGDSLNYSELRETLFDRYGSVKDDKNVATGALYPYGNSRQTVVEYVQSLSSLSELDGFIKFLASEAQIATNTITGRNLSDKKAQTIALLNDTTKVHDGLFNRFSGYIGQNRSDKLATLQAIRTPDQSKILPTFITQINYQDVNQLGQSSQWSANETSGNIYRLGLNLSEFLAIVVMQAMNADTQSNAITYLIRQNSNSQNNGTNGTVGVGDRRLLNALTTRWAHSQSRN